jgi:hypothetical protein
VLVLSKADQEVATSAVAIEEVAEEAITVVETVVEIVADAVVKEEEAVAVRTVVAEPEEEINLRNL